MPAMKLKVTYVDGRVEEVRVPPRVQIEVEQALGGLSSDKGLLMTYRFGWQALFKAGKEDAPFDRWIDELVEDVSEITEDVKPDPPAGEAPSPETTSTSPSEPVAPSES